MITAVQYPQVQINITLEDVNVLTYVKTLLKQMKGVRSVMVSALPKVSMTEEEFYQKIDHSIAIAKEGPRYEMNANESGAEFLQRLVREAQ